MWTKYDGCLLVNVLLLKHCLSDINNYATDAFMTDELQILHLSVCSFNLLENISFWIGSL